MKSNVVTSLALRYLCSCGQDRLAAFDGLRACCWKAKGHLYIKPDEDSDRCSMSYTSLRAWENCYAVDRENGCFKTYNEGRWEATRDFITARLREILQRYEDLILSDIQALADSGQLRWIAREVRNRMADYLRRTYKEQRPPEPLEPAITRLTDTRESAALVLNDLMRQKSRLVRLIGSRMFDSLCAVVRNYPFGSTRREVKGNITRAIAKERAVSHQQARADKKELVDNAARLDYLVCRSVERFVGSSDLSFRD